jgi:2-methylcitrate dehydratase PrpD
LIRAIAIGLEGTIRVALAAHGELHAKGFHSTAIAAPFGACLAASVLLGLDETRTTHAFGIAGSMAAGLFEFLAEGSTVKTMHPGWGAHGGITAARLARAGMTGPKTILEGRFGLYQTHIDDNWDSEIICRKLGLEWHQLETSFKPYPCCHFLHTTLDALQGLRQDHVFQIDDIDQVTCLIPRGAVQVVAEPWADKLRPSTSYAAKFSLPYTVTTMLVHNKIGLDLIGVGGTLDPKLENLMARVDYEIDPDSEAYPRSFASAVKIRLKDGRIISRREPYQRGGPDRPLSQTELMRKFEDNASDVLNSSEVKTIIEHILTVDDLVDLTPITKGLRGENNSSSMKAALSQ